MAFPVRNLKTRAVRMLTLSLPSASSVRHLLFYSYLRSYRPDYLDSKYTLHGQMSSECIPQSSRTSHCDITVTVIVTHFTVIIAEMLKDGVTVLESL